jgi:hypothetical protein
MFVGSVMTTEWQNFFRELASRAGSRPFPIDSVFLCVVDSDPNDMLGYGTWELMDTMDIGGETTYIWKRTE